MTKDQITMTNQYLKKCLKRKGRLWDAMRYSVLAGGKKFRPQLCFAAAQALGRNPKEILPIAAAIELLHTFTLIHDDLPAMDNSDFRRGKLACHKKFDEATAILAGDALNTLAFKILAAEVKRPEISAVIARALLEVVEGQVLDLATAGRKISLTKLKNIHAKKTAALLVACVQSVAVYFRASVKKTVALVNYAKHLGLAFQIADDLLDATASQKQLGKPAGADKLKGFPYYLGIERSKSIALSEKQKSIKALSIFGKKAGELRAIAEYVVDRSH